MSADGRYVAFQSFATNLVPGDSNSGSDIFVHDMLTGQTTRASVASDGTQANDFVTACLPALQCSGSFSPAISADGRYVIFQSNASNLVPGDTNGVEDIFVHDMQTGVTSRVSVASDGSQSNGSGFVDVNASPAISADGRYIAFRSWASNLVPGDPNHFQNNVFLHDMRTGQTSLVSVAYDGTRARGNSEFPSISADGRYVAFDSWADNLVPDDTNGVPDVFVSDMLTGQTTRISVASDGSQGDAIPDCTPSGTSCGGSFSPAISADGRYVAFGSASTNLVSGDINGATDVCLHDMQTGQTTHVSVSSDGSQGTGGPPAISAGGRYVLFVSDATNLVPGDSNGVSDIFIHDIQTGQTTLVSVASDGTQGNSGSSAPSISADGRYASFISGASNLVPGDVNGASDVFMYDRGCGVVTCLYLPLLVQGALSENAPAPALICQRSR